MKILVMGAGSIGSVFGGFLAEGGHEVTLVGRPWHMEAIQAKGLHISGIWGDHTVTNLRTLSSLPDEGGLDLVLLTVKSYQTRESVSELDRHILDPVPILSLQNGLGNLETIAEIVGPDRTLGGAGHLRSGDPQSRRGCGHGLCRPRRGGTHEGEPVSCPENRRNCGGRRWGRNPLHGYAGNRTVYLGQGALQCGAERSCIHS
ncbi:MAG: hypothetical protein COW52_09895 [Nitrospirae bacterium CG17_big_fil_post_rev_8_21_14_2_50_50_9]|nr:MAG: hypothetical protein COW52_09895 [Nitrospirae bacterium CG17_big_fil_post_rev_8_21_14_2_50_50_9]